MGRRSLLYSLLMPVMSQSVPGLDKGKAMPGRSLKPLHVPAVREVLTSYYRSRQFLERPHDPCTVYTRPSCAWTRTRACTRSCCAASSATWAPCSPRASSAPSASWRCTGRACTCRDIHTGELDPEITDRREGASFLLPTRSRPSAADVVGGHRHPAPVAAHQVHRRHRHRRHVAVHPHARVLRTAGACRSRAPCTPPPIECYFGLNLNPMCKPSDVAYTLIPSMCYFEFNCSSPLQCRAESNGDLVDLVDVRLGHEYEIVVTTYSGTYSGGARVCTGIAWATCCGLRVTGLKNEAPMFRFIRRQNVALSIDSDKITDETELHAAVSGAVQHLAPFAGGVHNKLRGRGDHPLRALLGAARAGRRARAGIRTSSRTAACSSMRPALNRGSSVYRACDKSIGPLEIRVVSRARASGVKKQAVCVTY
ncbi:hypothetical protein EJB05_16436, partial [Eragrostis curvula]